jgi:hypothetical protein
LWDAATRWVNRIICARELCGSAAQRCNASERERASACELHTANDSNARASVAFTLLLVLVFLLFFLFFLFFLIARRKGRLGLS